MNINELNRIHTVNIEEKIADVVAGSGTYREILDKVMCDEILPIVSSSGMIVGISYDSKVNNLIDDNIAQVAFEKRYRGKDVMRYVMSALKLKATNAQIAEVQEDASGVRVILENGEVITVEERCHPECVERQPAVELPSSVEIPLEAFGTEEDVTPRAIKAYLRNQYDHYLSGDYVDPDIVMEDGVIKVTNIHWGRKR